MLAQMHRVGAKSRRRCGRGGGPVPVQMRLEHTGETQPGRAPTVRLDSSLQVWVSPKQWGSLTRLGSSWRRANVAEANSGIAYPGAAAPGHMALAVRAGDTDWSSSIDPEQVVRVARIRVR